MESKYSPLHFLFLPNRPFNCRGRIDGCNIFDRDRVWISEGLLGESNHLVFLLSITDSLTHSPVISSHLFSCEVGVAGDDVGNGLEADVINFAETEEARSSADGAGVDRPWGSW